MELVRPDEFLPIFLDRHCFTHWPVDLRSKSLALEIADQFRVTYIAIVIAGRPGRPPIKKPNPPALARTAAIVRDRRHVTNRGDGEARSLQRAKRRFAART